MSRAKVAFLVGLTLSVISTFVINNIVVKGAKLGGEGISKSSTYSARLNPEEYYWEMLPFSILGGLVVGVIAFFVTYLITSNKK